MAHRRALFRMPALAVTKTTARQHLRSLSVAVRALSPTAAQAQFSSTSYRNSCNRSSTTTAAAATAVIGWRRQGPAALLCAPAGQMSAALVSTTNGHTCRAHTLCSPATQATAAARAPFAAGTQRRALHCGHTLVLRADKEREEVVGEEEAGELAPLVTALAGATARWRSQTSSVLVPWDFEYRDLLEDYVADFTLLLRAEHTEACRETAAQLVAHVYKYAQTRAEGDTALDLAVDMMQTFAESAGSLSRIGITFLTSFRRSLLTLQVKLRLREKSEPGSLPDYAQVLAPLDVHAKRVLHQLYGAPFLSVERITWDSQPATVIDFVAEHEVVHPNLLLSNFKRRFGLGRRVFGLFHVSLSKEPISFVHIALTPEIAPSLRYIRKCTGTPESESAPKAAVFYSITSTNDGLRGLDMAGNLLRGAIRNLQQEFPSITQFATLSPIPRFVPWLSTQLKHIQRGTWAGEGALESTATAAASAYVPRMFTNAEAGAVLEAYEAFFGNRDVDGVSGLSSDSDQGSKVTEATTTGGEEAAEARHPDAATSAALRLLLRSAAWAATPDVTDLLKPVLERLATQYVVHVKRDDGRPKCAVASFHLMHGAAVHRINWLGNTNAKGMRESAGMMINYLYEPVHLARRHAAFMEDGAFEVTGDEASQYAYGEDYQHSE